MRKEKSKGKGCCKLNKKVVLFLSTLIMLIALALNSYAISSGSAVIDLTSNSGTSRLTLNLNTLFILNWSSASNPIEGDVDGIAITFISSNTANSTERALFNITNGTGTTNTRNFNIAQHFNDTFGANYSSALEDNNVYTLKAYIYFNGTEASRSVTFVIDTTAPQLPSALSPSGTVTSRDQTLQATVTGVNTTACMLRFSEKNPGSNRYPAVHSGNTCSVAFTNFPRGTYTYSFDATDGTNTTAETVVTFTVDIRTTAAKKAYIASGGQLPVSSSATAQQKAKGQQTEDVLDRVIANAPPQAQQGLTKAKESITKQYKGKEAVKTWTGTGIGCSIGLIGLVIPPIGLITVPAGCVGGHITGMII